MKYKFLLFCSMILNVSCSGPNTISNHPEEVKLKTENIVIDTLKDSLYLGFREGMNWSQIKNQIDIEISNGNLPINKDDFSSSEIKENFPISYNMSLDGNKLNFLLEFKYSEDKLENIEIGITDVEFDVIYDNISHKEYGISEKGFNALYSRYKNKYGVNKIHDHQQRSSDINYLSDPKILVKTKIYVWQTGTKIVLIDKTLKPFYKYPSIKVFYFPASYDISNKYRWLDTDPSPNLRLKNI